MLESGKLTEVNEPCYRRYSMNLDQMNLSKDFRFYWLSHTDFWRNYKDVLKVGDIVEVRGRGCDCEFITQMIFRDEQGGCRMIFHGGHIPDEVELENVAV